MISLIKADLYKETRKKSFKVISVLIVFVSIFGLIFINKNLDNNINLNQLEPVYSKSEYNSINKHGNYKEYLNDYNKYEKIVNQENEILLKESKSTLTKLLSNTDLYLYIILIIVIFISYHSFSYDFQNKTLNYVFQSKYSRKQIYFSKAISLMLISLYLIFSVLIVMWISSWLLTHENIFIVYKYIFINNNLKRVPILLYYLVKGLVFLIPSLFVVTFSMFLSIIFKGNSIGLLISNIMYLFSILFSEILFKYGINFIEMTPLPYLDFTYLSNNVIVSINNMIYNLNLSYLNSFIVLIFYSLILILLSIKFLKKDV